MKHNKLRIWFKFWFWDVYLVKYCLTQIDRSLHAYICTTSRNIRGTYSHWSEMSGCSKRLDLEMTLLWVKVNLIETQINCPFSFDIFNRKQLIAGVVLGMAFLNFLRFAYINFSSFPLFSQSGKFPMIFVLSKILLHKKPSFPQISQSGKFPYFSM